MFPLLVHTCLYYFGVSFHLSCIFLGFSLLSMGYKISKWLCVGAGLCTFTEPTGLVPSWMCGPPISPGKLSSKISLVISYCLLFYFHSFWYSHHSDGNLSPKFFGFFFAYIFFPSYGYTFWETSSSASSNFPIVILNSAIILSISHSSFSLSISFTRSDFLSQCNFLKSLLQYCQMTKLR